MELNEVAAHEEANLIAQAIEGKAEAFAQLYDRHLGRVYRHIYFRVVNSADAEDLSQEVFLRAWRAIGRYRIKESPFIAWLLTIAHNLVRDHYRKKKGELSLDDLAQESLPAQPDREVEAYADKDELSRGLARLSLEQQQVLSLRFIDDLDYKEVAAIMGKREGAIRVLQHRALAQLRKIMEEERG